MLACWGGLAGVELWVSEAKAGALTLLVLASDVKPDATADSSSLSDYFVIKRNESRKRFAETEASPLGNAEEIM